MKNREMKKCPVCGFETLDANEPYGICPVCDWEDDPVQNDDPDFWGGANELCLNDYQDQWLRDHNVKAS
jgi:hypothetical protein